MTSKYPDVRITERDRFAISLKTTAGFRHHKLNLQIQPFAALPVNNSFAEMSQPPLTPKTCSSSKRQ